MRLFEPKSYIYIYIYIYSCIYIYIYIYLYVALQVKRSDKITIVRRRYPIHQITYKPKKIRACPFKKN
jgi:hypothetical protein